MRITEAPTCNVSGCENDRRARGVCKKHYAREFRGGLSPRKTAEERFWPLVNKTATCWEWTGPLFPGVRGGYGTFYLSGKARRAHRVAYEWLVAPIPEGLVIDHTCHNRGCVNPDHLRIATTKQNLENMSGANANSESGIRGVYWHKATSKWAAQVVHHCQKIHLGLFENISDAEAAVIAKRNELFTHNDMDRIAS